MNTLQRIGYNDFVEAIDGEEALAKFDPTVKFVITDWHMPRMSGIELTKALRLRDDGRDIPVLMVSARSVKADIIEALEAGVSNYIVKPITLPALKEKIDSMLAIRSSK